MIQLWQWVPYRGPFTYYIQIDIMLQIKIITDINESIFQAEVNSWIKQYVTETTHKVPTVIGIKSGSSIYMGEYYARIKTLVVSGNIQYVAVIKYRDDKLNKS